MAQSSEADVQTDACARLEQIRVTLEARVAALSADLATLQAAITAMRRRYPEVVVGGALRKEVSRARGQAMSHETIGWVMDKDTSKRRIHLWRGKEDVVGLAIEVPGQTPEPVLLDAEGLAALYNLVQRAILLVGQVGKDA
jgi:hypothetical protein